MSEISARLDCLRFAVDLAKEDPIIPSDEQIISCADRFYKFVAGEQAKDLNYDLGIPG